MKRFLTLLVVAIMLVSIIGVIAASASSASISISGNSLVEIGKTYTYSYKLSVSSACAANTSVVKVSGAFEIVSGGEALFYDTIPNNTSGSRTGSVKVRVKSNAAIGDTGKISLNGEYGWLDENYDQSYGTISTKTKTATVVEKAPAATKNPNATPRPPEGWEIVENSVADAQKGAVVESVMEDDYKIPESLLDDIIKNENILKINFGTYTCTIDPAALNETEGIKNLNLKLDFEKVEGLSEIAGGKDVYQLHFGHTGELPGKLSFTFEAKENKPGDTVYLYYYYGAANIIEGKMQAVVDENGMVTFDIYHCSSYFVTAEVIEGAQSNFDTKSAAQIEELTLALEEKQTELDDANAQIETLSSDKMALEADIVQAKNETANLEDEIEKANAEPVEQEGEYQLVVLIAAVAAAILLTILLTMLFTRAGLFRRSPEETEAKMQRKAQIKKAKMEADQAKEQQKQAEFEAKQQVKRDAVEEKRMARKARKANNEGLAEDGEILNAEEENKEL